MTTTTTETGTYYGTRQHVTLQQTHAAMLELTPVGKVPNVKLAFWNASLSKMNELGQNCEQCAVMRGYAHRPLPLSREQLWVELGSTLFRSHINTLYEIERLANAGIIHCNAGTTFSEQATWRRAMVAAIPGMGMKTVSFALHIYAPFQCLILTVDRHHLRRYGYDPSKGCSVARYLKVEQELYATVRAMEVSERGYAPIEYAACLWENWRQETGVSKCNGTYPSHAGLCCWI